jgi:hypothetical protein
MKGNRIHILILILLVSGGLAAQEPLSPQVLDSLYLEEVESQQGSPKVLHAEPLYIDLIRDLGARKGEKEWNVGVGITDNLRYDTYEALVEYEWAPIDRLGLEVELPFLIYAPQFDTERDSVPSSRLESIKLAAQWSFYVSERYKTSMALGYIHEFEFSSFREWGRPLFKGNLYNPFFIAAKRWGQNWHTLVYTGPRIEQYFADNTWGLGYEWHSNLHYMVPGTRNFIGVEVNKYLQEGQFDITMRPQMRLGISDELMLGIVGGIPIVRESQRFSLFLRLIWEPGHAMFTRPIFGRAPQRMGRHRHS